MKIAVLGPAASGKGTISHTLAANLDLVHIDAGLIFRALALIAVEYGVDWIDSNRSLVEYRWTVEGGADITVSDNSMSVLCRSDLAAQAASQFSNDRRFFEIAAYFANSVATRFLRVVCDGRNAGIEILPDADFKFVLQAEQEVRVHRRYEQLRRSDPSTSLESVRRSIVDRDALDEKRSHAPFRTPTDAIVIDSTFLDVKGTVACLLNIIQAHSQ